jgi:hypothetical protein
MAIIIDQEPQAYTPAFNQSPWVIRETDISGALGDWRMNITVISESLAGQVIATHQLRFREQADGTRRVVFDPSEIVQSFLSYDHSPVTSLGPWQIAPNSIHFYRLGINTQQFVNGQWANNKSVQSGVKGLFNGVVNSYAFPTYNQFALVSVNGQVPRPLTSYTPTIRDIGSNNSQWVHFIQGQELALASLTITKYPLPNLQGTPLPADPVQINPFQVFTGFPSIAGDQYSRRRVRVGIGTKDLQGIASPISFAGVQSYRCRFTMATGETVDFDFNITDCSKYSPTRLHWLNPFGGFDAFTFKMKSHEEDKVERASFRQQVNTLSGGSYGYTRDTFGMVDYHTTRQSELILNSDLLTDAEHNTLMRDLTSSPVIFIEDGNAFTAVNGKDTTFTTKRGVQDGTFHMEVRIAGTHKTTLQRL